MIVEILEKNERITSDGMSSQIGFFMLSEHVSTELFADNIEELRELLDKGHDKMRHWLRYKLVQPVCDHWTYVDNMRELHVGGEMVVMEFSFRVRGYANNRKLEHLFYRYIVKPVEAKLNAILVDEELEELEADRLAGLISRLARFFKTEPNPMLAAKTPDEFTAAVLDGPAFHTHENVRALFGEVA